MPIPTVEKLGHRAEALRKAIAGQAEGADAATKRRLSKELKRAQRKRRRMIAEAERIKAAEAKNAAKGAAAKEGATPEAPAEAPPAE